MSEFPIDYDEWRAEWRDWLGRQTFGRVRKSPFEGKNFLADEILGVWRIGGQAVELSSVTFPNLSERDERGRLIEKRNRMVGITREDGSTAVVRGFQELEDALTVSA